MLLLTRIQRRCLRRNAVLGPWYNHIEKIILKFAIRLYKDRYYNKIN